MALRFCILLFFAIQSMDARAEEAPKKKNFFKRLFTGELFRKNNSHINRDGTPILKAIPVSDEEYQDSLNGYSGPGEETWSARDEAEFSKWVTAIGESGCGNPKDCLNSPANYLKGNGGTERVYGEIDCGRLPYLLRGYFAEKKGLPFAATTDVSPLGPLGEMDGPIRYTAAGNKVTKRQWITQNNTQDRRGALLATLGYTNTKVYRIPADQDDSDMYPIKVSPKTIKPGTVYYDPSGHVAMVYKVENGVIHTLNASPGSHVTRKAFKASSFSWGANSKHGGGFKKFRPIVADQGYYRLARNSEMGDYSTEQYSHSGKNYFNFVSRQMGENIHPLTEFHDMLQEVCDKFRTRTQAVEKARLAGLPDINHPNGKLPPNIYGAVGDWETHSTPSADLRITLSLIEASNNARNNARDRKTRDAYQETFRRFENWDGCMFTYTNSQGQAVRLGLRDIVERGNKISFDPYLCPELRMGADLNSREGRSCNSSKEKIRWYNAQSTLRNRTEKDVNLFTGYTLEEMEARKNSLGPTQSPNIDLLNTLF